MNRLIRGLKAVTVATAAAALVATALSATALAAPKTPGTSATWSGKGTTAVSEGVYAFDTEVCGIENGAPVDGAYVVFVLASTKGLSAPMIKFGGADTPRAMDKSNGDKPGNGAYKYLWQPEEGDVDLAALLALPVSVDWTGNARPVLTVGHGCATGLLPPE